MLLWVVQKLRAMGVRLGLKEYNRGLQATKIEKKVLFMARKFIT